jgi:cytochrome b561
VHSAQWELSANQSCDLCTAKFIRPARLLAFASGVLYFVLQSLFLVCGRSLQTVLISPMQLSQWIPTQMLGVQMSAQADRRPHLFVDADFRERLLTALHGGIALIAVAIGVLGLQADSLPRQAVEAGINIHALFALLLCGLVFARCRWRLERSPRMRAVDIRELSRHLSRIVYLLLYLVIGVREVMGILHGLWHGGPIDFGLLDPTLDHAGFDSRDDFQLFFISGLFVLLFVRAVAFTLWLRSRTQAAHASQETVGRAARRLEAIDASCPRTRVPSRGHNLLKNNSTGRRRSHPT